jgi:zinc/manganese transport system substrate-binding protein
VVAADGVLCDLTQRLAGSDLQVACLLQPGDDPHQFHLTPQQSQQLRGAQLVLINGYGLTPALEKQAQAVAVAELAVPHTPRLDAPGHQPGEGPEAMPGTKTSEPGLERHRDSEPKDQHDGEAASETSSGNESEHEAIHPPVSQRQAGHNEEPHGHGDRDPHVWHDPAQAIAMVQLVAHQLEALKPQARQRIAGRAAAMVAVLQQLDRWNRQQFATIPAPPSPLATGHRAFASLARAYGLRELPVVDSLSSSKALRPQAFAAVLAQLKRDKVTTLFAETLPASKSLQRISALSGVPIAPAPLVADGLAKGAGLAGAQGSPAQGSSLVATLTTNTCLIVNGLKGRCDQAGQRRLVQQWAAIP